MALNDGSFNKKNTNKTPPPTGPGPAGSRPAYRRDDDEGGFSMTGIRSGATNSLAMKVMLGLLIAIFAFGIVLSAISPGGDPSVDAARRPMGSGPDPVARVGEQEVSRDVFQRRFVQQTQMMEQYGMAQGPLELLNTRQGVVESLAGEAAQLAEAQRRGLTATDEEIDKKIQEFISDALKPQAGQTEASVRRAIEAEHGSVEAFKETQIKNYDRALVSRQVTLEKLEKAIKDANKVTEDDYKKSVTKLALRQIKISPKPPAPPAKGAKPLDPKAAQEKSEADAKARAEKLAAQLKNAPAAQFASIAKTQSDDIATKAKGGDLGLKLPTELPFGTEVRDAVVAAKGSFVGPVQEPSTKDWYLFSISGRKLELPKDYAKNKAATLKSFEETKDNEAWSKYTNELREKNKAEILDPALVAYDIQNKQLPTATDDATRKNLRDDAIARYEESLNYAGASEAQAIRYQLALLYAEAGRRDDQLSTLKTAVDQGGEKEIRLAYARALNDAGRKADAAKELAALSKNITDSPSPAPQFSFSGASGSPDDALRQQIAGLYEQMGNKDLAAKERAKIKPPTQPGMPGGSINLGGGANQTITIPGR
jgi:foldase protein PrsA